MGKDLNSCSFIGNLGGDPEVKSTATSEFVNFSLAVSADYKDKGGNWVNKTNWINVTVFQEFLRKVVTDKLSKGSQVYVRTKLDVNKIGDKYYHNFILEEIQVLPKGNNGPSRDTQSNSTPVQTNEDELAF